MTVPGRQETSDICSTREAAEILGVSLRTIQMWVDGGVLKAWKTAGGHRRISLDSVRRAKEGLYPEPVSKHGPEVESGVLLAYQPILDQNERPFGYELLYRKGEEEQACIHDPLAATARVISVAFGELGVLSAMGDYLCFINVEEQMLFAELLLTLPAERVVLEIPAATVPTDDLMDRCRYLKERGYRLLIENFRTGESPERLLAEADYVKVDSRALESMSAVRLPPHVELVAGRVETEDSYRAARRGGAHYFQGFHFANLSVARGAKVAPQRAVVLDVLAKVIADACLSDIEKRLKLEPAICFSLLRLTNSAALSTGRRIENLREALMLLGRKNLLRWLQVLLFAHEDNPQRYPSSLMLAAAFRGRLLEHLAVVIHGKTILSEQAFMVGILSYVESLLRIPLHEVLSQLRISEDLEAALLRRQGVLGELLGLSEAMDRSDFVEAQAIARRLKISNEHLHIGQVESLRFSNALAHT